MNFSFIQMVWRFWKYLQINRQAIETSALNDLSEKLMVTSATRMCAKTCEEQSGVRFRRQNTARWNLTIPEEQWVAIMWHPGTSSSVKGTYGIINLKYMFLVVEETGAPGGNMQRPHRKALPQSRACGVTVPTPYAATSSYGPHYVCIHFSFHFHISGVDNSLWPLRVILRPLGGFPNPRLGTTGSDLFALIFLVQSNCLVAMAPCPDLSNWPTLWKPFTAPDISGWIPSDSSAKISIYLFPGGHDVWLVDHTQHVEPKPTSALSKHASREGPEADNKYGVIAQTRPA